MNPDDGPDPAEPTPVDRELEEYAAVVRGVFPIRAGRIELSLEEEPPTALDSAYAVALLQVTRSGEADPAPGEIVDMKLQEIVLPRPVPWSRARFEIWMSGWAAAVREILENGRPEPLGALLPAHLFDYPSVAPDDTSTVEAVRDALLASERLGWFLPGRSDAASWRAHDRQQIDRDADRLAAYLGATPLGVHARPGWLPVLEEGEGAGAATRLGGRPWLGSGEPWPPCGHCGRPMRFVLQLALSTLPGAFRSEGHQLLQVFVCDRDEPCCALACASWRADSTAAERVRVIDVASGGGPADPPPEDEARWTAARDDLIRLGLRNVPREPPPALFPARQVVGWTEVVEYPERLEPACSEEAIRSLVEDRARVELKRVHPDDIEFLYDQLARDGEKLGGWPAWLQGPDRPGCALCGAPCEPMFQLPSHGALPCQWGDAGMAYLTRCPTHPDVVGWMWQST